jgi:sensor c-di-GMP phosphodiesterase-like protein
VGTAGATAYAHGVYPPDFDPAAVRHGLQHGEFFLEYLPVVSLTDGHCLGAEALIRWRRNGLVVPPLEFIPATERTPLAGLITLWVADKLNEELSGWLRENPESYVSLNVPPEMLGRGGLEYAAKKSGLFAHTKQIVLEITERGVPDMIGIEALGETIGTGLRVALDDVTFAGGANLAVLARCQFAFLKLDRTLIEQIRPGATSPAWLASLRVFLAATPVGAIAEGVETKLQADVLRAAGVRAAQGYHFTKPLPVDEFLEYYRNAKPR